MKKYIKYFLYLIRHKYNVFKISIMEGKYIHALTHDLSKFSKAEFGPYARYLYGNYPSEKHMNSEELKSYKGLTQEQVKSDYLKAWEHHFKNNKHHECYWVSNGDCKEMPEKYIDEMIIDWCATGKIFKDTEVQYYIKSYRNKQFNKRTRLLIEEKLCLNYIKGLTLEEIIFKGSKYSNDKLDKYIEETTGISSVSSIIKNSENIKL